MSLETSPKSERAGRFDVRRHEQQCVFGIDQKYKLHVMYRMQSEDSGARVNQAGDNTVIVLGPNDSMIGVLYGPQTLSVVTAAGLKAFEIIKDWSDALMDNPHRNPTNVVDTAKQSETPTDLLYVQYDVSTHPTVHEISYRPPVDPYNWYRRGAHAVRVVVPLVRGRMPVPPHVAQPGETVTTVAPLIGPGGSMVVVAAGWQGGPSRVNTPRNPGWQENIARLTGSVGQYGTKFLRGALTPSTIEQRVMGECLLALMPAMRLRRLFPNDILPQDGITRGVLHRLPPLYKPSVVSRGPWYDPRLPPYLLALELLHVKKE